MRSGRGTYYWADGDKLEGTWLDGKKNGPLIFTRKSDGKKFERVYENDEKKSEKALN